MSFAAFITTDEFFFKFLLFRDGLPIECVVKRNKGIDEYAFFINSYLRKLNIPAASVFYNPNGLGRVLRNRMRLLGHEISTLAGCPELRDADFEATEEYHQYFLQKCAETWAKMQQVGELKRGEQTSFSKKE